MTTDRKFEIGPGPRFTPAHDVHAILTTIDNWMAERNPKEVAIIEIGCSEGQTTKDIARAFPETQVIGIDCSSGSRMVPEQAGEAPLKGRIGIHAKDLPNVKVLDIPSWKLELRDLDLHPSTEHLIFFIDGDHSFAGVRSDTLMAICMIAKGAAEGMIIWHDDYEEGCPEWCGVRRFLDDQTMVNVQHIPNTWIGVAMVDPTCDSIREVV